MRFVRFFLAVIVLFTLAFFLYFLMLLVTPFDPDRTKRLGITRFWTRLWQSALGIASEVTGAENINEGGPFIFASNHISYLDFMVLNSDFPVFLCFLGKKTLMWVPFFGLGFPLAGHVYIDRRNPESRLKSLDKMAERGRKGQHLLIFPGGKRAADGIIGEWKKGVFVLAIQMQRPVVPVAIIGSARLHGIGDLAPRPGTIKIKIGRPISTAGMTYDDRVRLLEQTREAVREMINLAA